LLLSIGCSAPSPDGTVAATTGRTAGAALSDKTGMLADIVMVELPGGSFEMGQEPSTDSESSSPKHTVAVKAFSMAKTTVTFAQYDVFARLTGRVLPQDEGLGRGSQPVININRVEMLAFISWLNEGAARRFRLPSEAEWEYAAHAGTSTFYYWGNDPDPNFANTSRDGGRDQFQYTAPVGSFPPNAFGLYDMAGNVWQAVEDCRHANYQGAPTDGSAWISDNCDSYIARGGYYGSRRAMRPISRSAVGAQFRSMGLGFRLAADQ
jgi:formylglycine-generating enzyme required for sulfatase activity